MKTFIVCTLIAALFCVNCSAQTKSFTKDSLSFFPTKKKQSTLLSRFFTNVGGFFKGDSSKKAPQPVMSMYTSASSTQDIYNALIQKRTELLFKRIIDENRKMYPTYSYTGFALPQK